MKRLTTLAIGLALTGAFAASAQAAPQYENDSRYYDRPHEDSSYNYRHRDRFSDEAIDRRVTRALNRELGNDADEINVSVRNGNVILSGFVDHWNDRRQARDVASNVPGVRDVYARNLRVKYR
jgi:osmotically-inducible protein OsmY